jgi:hypothetical protein
VKFNIEIADKEIKIIISILLFITALFCTILYEIRYRPIELEIDDSQIERIIEYAEEKAKAEIKKEGEKGP